MTVIISTIACIISILEIVYNEMKIVGFNEEANPKW